MVTSRKESHVIAAGVFKAKCLAILDEVNRTRQGYVITKRGRPIARVVPLDMVGDPYGLLGSIVRESDIVSPVDVRWRATR